MTSLIKNNWRIFIIVLIIMHINDWKTTQLVVWSPIEYVLSCVNKTTSLIQYLISKPSMSYEHIDQYKKTFNIISNNCMTFLLFLFISWINKLFETVGKEWSGVRLIGNSERDTEKENKWTKRTKNKWTSRDN